MGFVVRLVTIIFFSLNILSVQFSFAKPLRIKSISDLNFGILTQGDGPKIVGPQNLENATNASFEAKGDAYTAYTIILPISATISLNGRGRSPITISNFVSNPSEGANGLLSRNGKQIIYVGATLSAIPVNQPSGDYTGDYVVEILY